MDASLPPELLLADYPPPMAALAEGLRRIVQAAVPDALERVRSGWRVIGYDVPVGRRTAYFAWIMTERAHVHLGFPKGVLLDDPDGILEGRGITKAARWFTLQAPDDLLDERLGRFARSAADLARLTASARTGRLARGQAEATNG